MTKHLVEIDDTLLEQARAATGAPTVRATVEVALRRVVAEKTVRRHVEWLRAGDGLDLGALADIRAPTHPEADLTPPPQGLERGAAGQMEPTGAP